MQTREVEYKAKDLPEELLDGLDVQGDQTVKVSLTVVEEDDDELYKAFVQRTEEFDKKRMRLDNFDPAQHVREIRERAQGINPDDNK